jgi:antitoxin (DNA-binding transcriptional repressor) of toxin-antitoxin stability system
MNATIVDLRYRMKDVLRAIDRGEAVTILYRGKEKARLTPIPLASTPDGKGSLKTKDQPLFGLWRDRDELADPVAHVRSLRQPRPVPTQGSIRKRRGTATKPK